MKITEISRKKSEVLGGQPGHIGLVEFYQCLEFDQW